MRGQKVIAALALAALTGLTATQSASAALSKQAREEMELGSVFVRCDGAPAHRSGAETAGRILLIMATAGLAGPGELKDTSKRLKGDEAVTACDAALAQETDPVRRVQLTLARAVHYIETKKFDAALADARNAPSLADKEGDNLGFKHSLLLSAMNLEAQVLVRLNRPAEAEAVALKMAEVAPYDLIAQQQAARFVGLTADLPPAKKAFLDRFGRIAPRGLFSLAYSAEWAGNFKASAEALQAYADVVRSFSDDKDPVPPMPGIEAHIAVALAMAGDTEHSASLAADTRKTVDQLVASGRALNMQNVITEAEEILDFHAVVAKANAGDLTGARQAFNGRSRWLALSPAAIAEMTARLRVGAKPAELTGALARDPAEIRANGLAARLGAIVEVNDAEKALYTAIRPPMTAEDYKYWADDIRDVEDSDYLVKRKPKDTYKGDFIYMRRPNGLATGDALLMHCALLAKHKGVKGFMMYPVRKRLDSQFVLFGNPGEPGFPAPAMIDADTVITALTGEFPEKPKRR